MAQIKTLRGHRAEHPRVRVFIFELRRTDGQRVLRGSALVLLEDIRDLEVLNRIVGNAADDGAKPRTGVVADQIVDEDALHRSRLSWCPSVRATALRAE